MLTSPRRHTFPLQTLMFCLHPSPTRLAPVLNLLYFIIRRVHITEEVVKCLGDDFEFEAGDGIERNAYLRDNNIKTYFVKPNSTRAQVSLSLVTKN